MGLFSRRKKTPDTIVSSLKKSFSKIDFENVSKMKRLMNRCSSNKDKLEKTMDKIKEQIANCQSELDMYPTSKAFLYEHEHNLSSKLKEIADDVSTERTQVLMDLRTCQFKLKTIDREASDYERTAEALKQFQIDINDAINTLDYMIGSLKRNIARVDAAKSLLQIEDTPERLHTVLGIDIDLSSVNAANTNEKRLKNILDKTEKKLDKIANKAKVDANVRVGERYCICSAINGGRRGYLFAVHIPGQGHRSLYQAYRHSRVLLFQVIEKIPELLEKIERGIKEKNQSVEKDLVKTIESLKKIA